ncbi:stage V sporulation protein S [Virgibacillus halodenitrificans]|uniref:stage V sporulation protein S n=1 Tax=Virgibacillus halodenitrificans TaxID=1482 RepID=UPI000EF4CEC0|nr:stage V sporulation protein S [Virgibacillus halodenitrificans]
MEQLKVSAKSNPKKVAGAIAGSTKEEGQVKVQAIGAGAVNQAIKAISIARSFVRKEKTDLICVPSLIDVPVDGGQITAVELLVERR